MIEPYKLVQNIKSVLLVALLVALLFSIRTCRKEADNSSSMQNYLASLNDTITYLKNGIAQKPAVEVNESTFKQIVEENENLKKALKDAKIKAKDVKTVTTIVTEIQTDTISITLHDSIPCDFTKPIAFSVDSAFYSISGQITKKNIQIGHINFPDSLYVITAEKRKLFKKNEFIVSVGHSNPLIRTVGLTNLTIKEDKKFYDSFWVKAGIGFVTGSYLTYKIVK